MHQFGTPEDDLGVVAGVDQECNVYVAGTTRGMLKEGPQQGAFQDAFLAKLDPGASLQWVRQLGSREDDTVRGLAVSRSGESFVVGSTLADMPGGTRLGGSDVYVMKHDASGALAWLSHRGSAQDDQGLAVALSERDEHVIVAGATMAKPEVGLDVLLDVLHMADGAEVRMEQYGTDLSDRAEGIALDGSGGVYVTGSTLGHLGATNTGSFDAFLARFDAGLRPSWVSQRSTRDIDAGMKVATDAQGNVYVLALSFSDLETERFENDGISSPFLLKYGPEGGLQWVRRIGPAREPTRGAGLAVDGDGFVFVVGSTPGALAGPNQGGRDAFVAKYDALGNAVWAQQLGTRGQDEAQDVVITARGTSSSWAPLPATSVGAAVEGRTCSSPASPVTNSSNQPRRRHARQKRNPAWWVCAAHRGGAGHGAGPAGGCRREG
ncbi:SBBP repeat-containing protein [Pyxidicoccus sp. 3LFB2]